MKDRGIGTKCPYYVNAKPKLKSSIAYGHSHVVCACGVKRFFHAITSVQLMCQISWMDSRIGCLPSTEYFPEGDTIGPLNKTTVTEYLPASDTIGPLNKTTVISHNPVYWGLGGNLTVLENPTD